MKKVFLIVTVIAFVGVSIVSCKNEKKEHHEHAEVAYACPMECEGGKTYTDKNTKCPVCKMALVEKKSEGGHQLDKKDEHEGDGEHGEHDGHDSDGEKHKEESEGHDHDEH